MGKETKIGLTVLGLLLGVFGLVVYFKVFRPEAGPSPEAVASALEQAEQSTVAAVDALDGGPAVQLSPGAAEQAPVEFGTESVPPDAYGAPASPELTDQAGAENSAAPPVSSRRRYADAAAGGEAAPLEAEPMADDRYAQEPYADNLQTPVAAGHEVAAEGLAEPPLEPAEIIDTAPRAFAQESEPHGEPAAAEPVQTEPVEQTLAEFDAEHDFSRAAPPPAPAELPESAPAYFAPNARGTAPSATIQAGAEEVVAEPPQTLEPVADDPRAIEPQAGGEDRYGRPAAPAYQPVAQEPPAAEPSEAEPPIRSREIAPSPRAAAPSVAAPSRARSVEPAAPPARLPAEDRFARPDQSYTIEPNDNYWRISQKLYGTGGYFKALFEHNRQKYPRADRLRQGDVISAPPVEVLEKTYPDLCPKPQHRQAEQKMTRAVSTRRLPRGDRVYVVEEGDTLFDIAKYELGQASRWGELYELNRDVLGDQGDHLKPGLELVLPAERVRESVAVEPGQPVR